MDLKTFLSSMSVAEREVFALRCGTTRGHMQNVSYGKPCAPALATAIELHSKRQVTRQELRKDWKQIWPELAERKVA